MIKYDRSAQDESAGMTLGELYQALQAANNLGADPREVVKVRVGFKGQIKSVSIAVQDN